MLGLQLAATSLWHCGTAITSTVQVNRKSIMVLKLYGLPLSQPTRAVIWALNWKGLKYELITIMPGSREKNGSRSEEYLRICPSGNIPAIDDDGFVLYESNAILVRVILAQAESEISICITLSVSTWIDIDG